MGHGRTIRRALLAALLALGACAGPSAQQQRFSGVWEWGFETSSFTTDAGEGPYWLHAEGQPWQALNAPFAADGGARGPWGTLHIVVEGELSPPGRYGHLGAYERELAVVRVIEAERIASAP